MEASSVFRELEVQQGNKHFPIARCVITLDVKTVLSCKIVLFHYIVSVLCPVNVQFHFVSPLFLSFISDLLEQARLERMAEFQQRGEDLESNYAECKRQLEEARGLLKELDEGRKEGEEDEEQEAELKKVTKLMEDEKSFEKMINEHRQEEKKLPWNVDTISKEGFSKVRLWY